jgi:hypothetical protein
MPATFESLGIKFLYPDNWAVSERDESEGDQGVTLELPTGGFFSLEREREGRTAEELIEEVNEALQEDYGEVEREEFRLEDAPADERAVDFRFYYLDLVVISRLVIVQTDTARYLIQMQAESRDFDANAMVLLAILKQIRG